MVHGHHYHSDNNPARKCVESDNLRTMFDLAKRLGNKPIVHFKAAHMPQSKAPALEMVSPKEFQGMLIDFVAYEGMPVMLLQNIAPQYALYNGSIVKYKGVLYLTDEIEVKLKSSELSKLKIRNLTVMEPLDLKGGTTGSRYHQLPKNAVLISIDNQPILSDNALKSVIEMGDTGRSVTTGTGVQIFSPGADQPSWILRRDFREFCSRFGQVCSASIWLEVQRCMMA